MRIAVWMTALVALGCASGGSPAPEGGVRDVAETPQGGNGREGPHIVYGNADVGDQQVVFVSIDSAYKALATAYKSLGFDLKVDDPNQHLLGNRHVVKMRMMLGSRLSTFFNCGNDPAIGSPRADSYQLVFSVISTLTAKDSETTRIVTLVTGQANDMSTSASSVYCPSSGKLERAIVRAAGFDPR
jgi:hypothetical protein